jgi:uncharacterized protein YkwD
MTAGLSKERRRMGRIAATRRGATGAVILLVTLLFLGFLQTPAHAATSLERQMLNLTNASRADHGVHRLRLDAGRTTKAHKHSAAMARCDCGLFHTGDPADFYLRGVRWSKWGENVGETSGSDLSVLQQAFMDSPVHRHNILDDRFRRVGVGVVVRDGKAWVTLFFYG